MLEVRLHFQFPQGINHLLYDNKQAAHVAEPILRFEELPAQDVLGICLYLRDIRLCDLEWYRIVNTGMARYKTA